MTHTRIGPSQVITGDIRAGEDLSIYGRVKGQIEAEGLVIIEAGAIIEAGVRAREVVVRGVVVGDVHAVDLLEVTANGQVAGSVQAKRLQLHAGGRIAGVVATGMEIQGFLFGHKRGSTKESMLRAGTMTAPPRTSRPTTPPSFGSRSSSFSSAPRPSTPLPSRKPSFPSRPTPDPTPTPRPRPTTRPRVPTPPPPIPASDVKTSDNWMMENLADELPLLDQRGGDSDDLTLLDTLPAFPSIDDTMPPVPAASDPPEPTPPAAEEHVEVTPEPPGEVVETDAAPEPEEHEPF